MGISWKGRQPVVASAVALLCVAGCTIGPVTSGDRSVASRGASVRPSQDSLSADTSVRYEYPAARADANQNFGRLYLPTGERAARSVPLVVLIHGGGWQSSATLKYMVDVARSLQSSGLAVWNIEYRRVGTGGGWPTTFTDVAAAIDFVPQLATRAAMIDPANVVFVGHSAGGQLAAWAAARRTLPPGAPGAEPAVIPRVFVSLSGVLDMRVSSKLNGHVRSVLGTAPAGGVDRLGLMNPIQRIDRQVPSVAIHGTADRVVPYAESVSYVAAAQAMGAQSMLVPLSGGNHGSPVNTQARWWPKVRETIHRLATGGFGALLAEPPK